MVRKKEHEGQDDKAEIRYTRQELLSDSEALFDVKPEVLMAALHGDARQELSVKEAQTAVKDFLKRRVM